MIGANGAGKSTALRTISGLVRAERGEIIFDGRRIDQVAVEDVVRLGIAHSPEGRRIFPGLTVAENLELGAVPWRRRGASIATDLAAVYRLFPRLEERVRQLAWSLSGGEQQMLAVGRALMARPRLLLLDEPSLGLAPMLARQLFDAIAEVNRRGVTVLLVEQNAFLALEFASRGYVVETGRIVLSDTTANLRRNDAVREAYLGA